MNKTSLVIMAAGIGSRFGGGIKQLTSFGPNGEIIMDYSIYDAIRAGFDRVVFVIRKDLETDFRSIIGRRIEQHIDTAYAFQELDDLPEGYPLPAGRTKPWGTGQAILACRNILHEPFAVINADDYYGQDAFDKVHAYLTQEHPKTPAPVCMAGFILKNTLSDNGGVTRGICSLDGNGKLTGVNETRGIVRTPEGAGVLQADGTCLPIDENSLASMNFWGFMPSFMDTLREGFGRFLSQLTDDNKLTAEYLLPTIVDGMLHEQSASVTVLPTEDKWFGVTYKEDVPVVIREFSELIERNVYPRKLWS